MARLQIRRLSRFYISQFCVRWCLGHVIRVWLCCRLQVEADVYILDYNPTVITGLQAFCVALTNFDCKLLL